MGASIPSDQVAAAVTGTRTALVLCTARSVVRLRPMITPGGQITTDRATRYFEPIARILTGVSHIAFKSRKALRWHMLLFAKYYKEVILKSP
jgi:hypothetical protein